MKAQKQTKQNVSLLKKILIGCAALAVVVASVVSVVALTKPKNTVEPKHGSEKSGIYYATPDEIEASGVDDAPIETKGGAFYVAKGDKLELSSDIVLEGYTGKTYGGAIYVADGGTLILNGATIMFCGASYGSAIYAEQGSTVEINEGTKIVCNTAPNCNGAAICVEDVEGNPVNKTISEAAEISNNYTTDYEDYVAYYVNGVFQTAAPLEETGNVFKVYDQNGDLYYAPLAYNECCGYFTDTGLTNNIEIGNSVASKITPTSEGGRNFYKVYTKRATEAGKNNECIDFDSSSIYTEVSQRSSNKPSGELVIPRTIIYNNYEYYVRNVAYEGFAANNNITAIYLPSTIVYVKEKAFNDCTNVRYLALPKNGALTTIGQRAFHGFYRNTQTSLVIPNSVETIGKYAFYSWKSYNGTTMDLKLSNQLTVIESGVFGNAGVASVDFNGAPITKIKNESFHYNKLTSISLPSTLISIYDHAFNNNRLVKNDTFIIPHSVKEIGTGAFDYNGANEDIDALYTTYNGGYYLGREDHGTDELYPTSQTVGGQYYNPYYFLVGFWSETLNRESYTDSKGTFTCYKLSPYVKFISSETIYALRQKVDSSVQLLQVVDDSTDNSYYLDDNSHNWVAYQMRYKIHVISSTEKTAGLWLEYVTQEWASEHGTSYVFVPSIYDDYEWGCLRGVWGVTHLVINARFSRLGNFFTDQNKRDDDNDYVPSNIYTVRLTDSFVPTGKTNMVEPAALCRCNVQNVYISGESIEEITRYAFIGSSVQNVYFGKNVKRIGHYSFVMRHGFNIHYDGTLEDWAHIDFDIWNNYTDTGSTYLNGWNLYTGATNGSIGTLAQNVEIETNQINAYSFSNCNLTKVNINNGVSNQHSNNNPDLSVGVEAFAYCTSLTEFTYDYQHERITGDAIVAFNNDCFWGCSSLEYFVIMEGAMTGTTMLGNCSSLKSVYIDSGMERLPVNGWGNAICTNSWNVQFYVKQGTDITVWGTYWNDASHSNTKISESVRDRRNLPVIFVNDISDMFNE